MMEEIIMLPRLYKASKTNTVAGLFNNNGYGFFNACTSCEVTEERNGEYTLTMTIASSDRLAKTVAVGMLIKAKANQYDEPQLFYINKTEVDKNGNITISANHLKYLFYQNATQGNLTGNGLTGTPQYVMNRLFNNLVFDNLFSFYSDITTSSSFSLGVDDVQKLGDICGGTDGSLIDVYGGEYHFDNFNVNLLKSRGESTGKRIMYGKNISDYSQTISNNDKYTHVMPYATIKCTKADGTDGETTVTVEPYDIVSAATLSTTVFYNVLKLDLTSDMSDYSLDFSKPNIIGEAYAEVQTELKTLAKEYTSKRSFDTEEVSISVTYDSELDKLQDIKLCDTVNVIFGKLNTVTTAKVTQVTYDSLHERYTSIIIGDKELSLNDFVSTQRKYK